MPKNSPRPSRQLYRNYDGMLGVVVGTEQSRGKGGHVQYKVKCADCGEIHLRDSKQLKQGIKSRDCIHHKSSNAKKDSPQLGKLGFKDWYLQKNYGISLADYNQMLEDQGGVCAICAADPPNGRKKYLCVDHDHETGHVRGLLCDACNRALGLLKDNAEVLARASVYLFKHTTAR